MAGTAAVVADVVVAATATVTTAVAIARVVTGAAVVVVTVVVVVAVAAGVALVGVAASAVVAPVASAVVAPAPVAAVVVVVAVAVVVVVVVAAVGVDHVDEDECTSRCEMLRRGEQVCTESAGGFRGVAPKIYRERVLAAILPQTHTQWRLGGLHFIQTIRTIQTTQTIGTIQTIRMIQTPGHQVGISAGSQRPGRCDLTTVRRGPYVRVSHPTMSLFFPRGSRGNPGWCSPATVESGSRASFNSGFQLLHFGMKRSGAVASMLGS